MNANTRVGGESSLEEIGQAALADRLRHARAGGRCRSCSCSDDELGPFLGRESRRPLVRSALACFTQPATADAARSRSRATAATV